MRDESQETLTKCPRCGKLVPWGDNPSNPVNWPQWGNKVIRHDCNPSGSSDPATDQGTNAVKA